MAIRDIVRMGHPVLLARAQPVEDAAAPEIAALIRDMAETMVAAPGVGLAAPQVAVPLRVIVFNVPADRVGHGDAAAGETPLAVTALINPALEPIGHEMLGGWEGCLSIPGMRGYVPRYRSVRFTGAGPDGTRLESVATGFLARILQHEIDHLDGVLYPMRMPDLSRFGFVDALAVSGSDEEEPVAPPDEGPSENASSDGKESDHG